MYLHNLECCGIRELHGIAHGSAENAVKTVYRDRVLDEEAYALVLFTATTQGRYGYKFATYIQKQKLGTVIHAGGPIKNPNSINRINAWMWKIDLRGLKKWGKERNIRKPRCRFYHDYPVWGDR